VNVETTKLLRQIATEPLILAVRLADKFDCDIEGVEDALLPHLNGRVFPREVTAPNQRKITAYVLSDAYRTEVLAGQVARDPSVQRRAAIRDAAPGVNMYSLGSVRNSSNRSPPPGPMDPTSRALPSRSAPSNISRRSRATAVPTTRCE
jgi:hypothetical protein